MSRKLEIEIAELHKKVDFILERLDNEPKPLTVKLYASKYHRSESYVRQLMKEGKLKYEIIGKTKMPIG